ncbi:hypothetical protein LWI28_021372 [Acer negundo]|uniref:Uncharacterized protein n=1 Tax=Acer negundo TaxID=4023 RepID=A0AAD5JH82_ACENE|nr:hypothetical protein LWI28_021372 [Acer negundo]KAK4853627.1 hypothetical protein QYF36_011844 [Acer negundo]
MGCFCSRTSSSSSSSKSTIKNIRVVHLNGHVEDFMFPVSVSQVTGWSQNHFLCTAAQLLVIGSKPLKPDTLLEPGHIYFLLPSSALQADVSPLDLASLVKRLTAKAKSSKSQQGSCSPEMETGVKGLSRKQRPWRPILDTIREISFNRRSESDLQEANLG